MLQGHPGQGRCEEGHQDVPGEDLNLGLRLSKSDNDDGDNDLGFLPTLEHKMHLLP